LAVLVEKKAPHKKTPTLPINIRGKYFTPPGDLKKKNNLEINFSFVPPPNKFFLNPKRKIKYNLRNSLPQVL